MRRKPWIMFALAFGFVQLVTAGVPASVAAQSTVDTILKNKVVRVGWAVYHPYVYRDPKTNEVTGISIEILHDLAAAFGNDVKLELVEDSWGTLAAGLQSNKFDIFPNVAVTLSRAAAVGFSEPFIKNAYTLIAKKDAVAQRKSWQDFDKKDQKIGVTLGSSTDKYLTAAIKQAEIVRLKTTPELILALTSGRTNAMAATLDGLIPIRKEYPNLAITSGHFAIGELAMATRRGDLEWIAWVNLFLRQERLTGRIKELLTKYGLDYSFAAE